MSRKKKLRVVVLSRYFWAAVGMTVVVLGGVVWGVQGRGNLAPAEAEKPGIMIDKTNDGVYTNYKYKYRFEYPNDKFVQTFSDEEGGGWIYEFGKHGYALLNATPLNMNFSNRYLELYNMSVGKSIEIRGALLTKLVSAEHNSVKFLEIYIKTLPYAESDHIVGYEAIWFLSNNEAVILSMYADPAIDEGLEFIDTNRNLFDGVVESFSIIKG